MLDEESCCSSDDEVFFGPITKKEIKKALQLRRRTMILRPVSECAGGTPGSSSAGTEEPRQSLTLTSHCARRREDVIRLWRCRSVDRLLDCYDGGEAETVAPPPSPELRYNGSPYPTPNHCLRRLCSTFEEIAEEERHSLQCSSVASDASSSLLLSRPAVGLVEDISRLSLVPAMSGATPQESDEELKIRDILIEKMEEHEARMQQLRGTKKQTTSVPQDFRKSLFEAEHYDIIILDDDKNGFSLNDNIPANQEVEIWNDGNLEVTSAGSEPSTGNHQQLAPNAAATGDKVEGYHFSRLIPERDFASPVGDHDDIFCQSIYHGDTEYRKDRDAVTALESQLSEVGTTDDASFTSRARPPSPEFDIEVPEAKASPPGNITAQVEACNTNCPSVLSEAAVYRASLKHATVDSLKLTENITTCAECSRDGCGSAVRKERDGMEMHFEALPLRDASGELREERRGQKECLRKTGTNDDDEGTWPYIVEGGSVLDSSLSSWGRELDASSDLNDSDRRKIEDLKKLQSCGDEEEFHDSLEEIELLLKFGMDYMMSSNDECLGMTGKKQSPGDSVSARAKPQFEDFGDAVRETESHRHLAGGTETSCEECGAVASVSDQNAVPYSHCSLSEAGEKGFVRPRAMSVRKPHSKLQAVVSPTVRSKKPGAFRTPGKPVLAGTPFQKLFPPRSVKKSPLKPVVTASPSRRAVKYSQIVSPVGAYIHNTPSPSLVTIVKPKGTMVGRGATAVVRQDSMPALEVARRLDRDDRENVDTSNILPVLPIVSYESVPSVKLEEPQRDRLPHLNEKMKKLMDAPKPHVFRHKGRVKVTASPRAPNVKKHTTDLDSSYMAAADADGEISVVISKQVTRTNTLGV